MSSEELETRALKYEFSVDIDAPREAVWRSLVDEMDAWWLPDFRMVGAGSVVSFEARAGGQMIETQEDGSSLLWCLHRTIVMPFHLTRLKRNPRPKLWSRRRRLRTRHCPHCQAEAASQRAS